MISLFLQFSDGYLDLIMIKDCTKLGLLSLITQMNNGGHVKSPYVTYLKVSPLFCIKFISIFEEFLCYYVSFCVICSVCSLSPLVPPCLKNGILEMVPQLFPFLCYSVHPFPARPHRHRTLHPVHEKGKLEKGSTVFHSEREREK